MRGIVKFCLYANPNRGKILLCSLRSEPRILGTSRSTASLPKSFPGNLGRPIRVAEHIANFRSNQVYSFFAWPAVPGTQFRFPLGLAQKKPAPLAPARAKGPPRPTTREGRLWVSKAGRESRPHPRGWLCVCLPDSDGRLRGRECFLSPSHPRMVAESAASPHRHARPCSGATLGLLPNNTHLHQRFKVKSLAEIDSTVSTWGGTTLLSPKRARGRAVEKAASRAGRAADER